MKKLAFAGLFALVLAAPAVAEEAAPAPVEIAAVAEAPAAAAPALDIERREMILTATGLRVGNVISLNADGSPRVIFEEEVVSIPLTTLSRDGDRLVTTLTYRDLRAM